MSKSFTFIVKSFLGNFYRHLAIFFSPHCKRASSSSSQIFGFVQNFDCFPPNFWRENFFWSKLVFILLKESDLKNFVDTCCHADVRRRRVQKNYFEGDDNDSMDVNVTADVVVVRHYSFRRHCFSGERCF